PWVNKRRSSRRKPAPLRSNWRCVPSPQSTRMRWLPASIRMPGWLRSADGTLADVPRKVRANIRGLGSGRLPLRPGRRRLLCRGFLCLLLAANRHQHLLLAGRRLPRLLGRFLQRFGFGRCAAHTPPQRLHQVNDVFAPRPLLRRNRLACTLLVDEVDEGSFVLVLELVRLEPPGLLVHDVLGEIGHV